MIANNRPESTGKEFKGTEMYELLTSEKVLTEYKSLDEALEYAYNQIGGLKLGHTEEDEWKVWYCVGDKVLNALFGTITRREQ